MTVERNSAPHPPDRAPVSQGVHRAQRNHRASAHRQSGMTHDTSAAPLSADHAALADLARRERFFEALAQSLAEQRCVKLVLGKPRRTGAGADADLVRVTARPLTLKGEACLSLVYRHKTKDITKNPPLADGLTAVRELLGSVFSHAHLFTTTEELQLMVSKRGKVGLVRTALDSPAPEALVAAATHDRQKQRYLTLDLPFLQDLGVTDAQHKLVPAMARKWKQINKFVEVLDHALDSAGLAPKNTAAPTPAARSAWWTSGPARATSPSPPTTTSPTAAACPPW